MIQFIYNEKEYNMQDDWQKLTFGQYYKIIKMIDSSKIIRLPEIIESIELISILTNTIDDLDEIPYDLHLQLAPYVELLIRGIENLNNVKHLKVRKDHYDINNTIYSYNKTGEFTAAEVSDIAIYTQQQQAGLISDIELVLKVASVIIRPACEAETDAGTKYWKLFKKDTKDQPIFEANIMMMNCLWVSSVVNFFFNGKKTTTKSTKNYSIRKI